MKLGSLAWGALGLAGATLTVAACAVDATDTSAAGTSAALGTQPRPGRQRLGGHLTDEMTRAPIDGRVAASTQMTLSIHLAVPDPRALADAVAQVSAPASPSYRRYLSPEQFGERFGASAADYGAVLSWARSMNLSVDAHPNRLTVSVTGTVADLEAALHVNFNYALRPDGSRFYLPDAEPSLNLSVPVQYISNLQNYVVPRHAARARGRTDRGKVPTSETPTLRERA